MTRTQEDSRQIPFPDFISRLFSEISKKYSPAIDKESINYLYLQWMSSHLPTVMKSAISEKSSIAPKDTQEAFDRTVDCFRFERWDESLLKDIDAYDPETDSLRDFYRVRSEELAQDIALWRIDLAQIPDTEPNQKYRKPIQSKIDRTEDWRHAEPSIATLARATAIDLRDRLEKKADVTTNDLYRALAVFFNRRGRLDTSSNKRGLTVEPGAGKLRGYEALEFQRKIVGITTSLVPTRVFQMLKLIAQGIRKVDWQRNPIQKKAMAIQLAAFAEMMIISIHPFGNGNKRSARMFADMILMTFGLPPHILQHETIADLCHTIGDKLDFKSGAQAVLQGVRQSSELLKAVNSLTPAQRMQNRSVPLYAVTQRALKKLHVFKEQAQDAKRRKNSDEWLHFMGALDQCCELAESILNENVSTAERNIRKIQYTKAILAMRWAAIFYKREKLKNRTCNVEANPDRKPLNEDDRGKLEVIDLLLKDTELIECEAPPQLISLTGHDKVPIVPECIGENSISQKPEKSGATVQCS